MDQVLVDESDPVKIKNRRLYTRRGSGRRQDHGTRNNSDAIKWWDEPEDKILYRRRRDRRHGIEDVED